MMRPIPVHFHGPAGALRPPGMHTLTIPHFAGGGDVHAGPIRSQVAGRTDHIPLRVAGGSYVIPADVVSGIGQGNTEAGHGIITRMIGGSSPASAYARGGSAPVDILAAGGEYVIPPNKVAEVGRGNMKRGHDILDQFVLEQRKKLVKTLSKLPGPSRK